MSGHRRKNENERKQLQAQETIHFFLHKYNTHKTTLRRKYLCGWKSLRTPMLFPGFCLALFILQEEEVKYETAIKLGRWDENRDLNT